MSGGSFNYLCDRDAVDLIHDDRDLVVMRKALAEYPHAAQAVALTDRALAHLAVIRTHLDALAAMRRDLYDVHHAVEWHRSADVSEDAVTRALAAFNTRPAE